MAIGHFSYLDLSPDHRRMAAKAVRERLQAVMANPFLSAEQQAMLTSQMVRIDQWEAGILHHHVEVSKEEAPKLPPKDLSHKGLSWDATGKEAPRHLPEHHAVTLSETVELSDSPVEEITITVEDD